MSVPSRSVPRAAQPPNQEVAEAAARPEPATSEPHGSTAVDDERAHWAARRLEAVLDVPSATERQERLAKAAAAVPLPPRRLLSVELSAGYMGVSAWSIRDWVLAGLLPTVELPAQRPPAGGRASTRPMRRVLIDRRDLDAFIESRKKR